MIIEPLSLYIARQRSPCVTARTLRVVGHNQLRRRDCVPPRVAVGTRAVANVVQRLGLTGLLGLFLHLDEGEETSDEVGVAVVA